MKLGKICTWGLTILLFVSIFATVASSDYQIDEGRIEEISADFAGGSGTEEDPYLIENVTQLQKMNENLSAHYELIDDINASKTSEWNDGNGFTPIGNDENEFDGGFDGKGFKITDLYIYQGHGDDIGLFGKIGESGSVKKVALADAEIKGYKNVGGIAGFNDQGTIKKCYAKGTIKSSIDGEYIGGLVGNNKGGTVNNSYSLATVNGNNKVGGLVGGNEYGKIIDSYAMGKTSGDLSVGGLVGYQLFTGSASDSFWDVITTGQEESSAGTGKTTEEMKDVSTFTDESKEGLQEAWDFVDDPNGDDKSEDIWDIDENTNGGYPFLTEVDVDESNWAPFPPKNPSPVDESEEVSTNPTLKVDVYDFNGDSMNVTFYDANENIKISTDYDVPNGGTASIKLSNLSAGKTFEWFAYAEDGKTGSLSPTWSFETMDSEKLKADAGNNKTVGIGEEFSLNASTSYDNADIASYEWNMGNGDNKTGEKINYTYSNPGNYSIKLTVTNENGDSVTDTVTIIVKDMTGPTADAGDNKNVEVDEQFILSASNSFDNVRIASYEWDLGNGDSEKGEQINYSYAEKGNYTVELIVTDEAGNTDTDTIKITVVELDSGNDDNESDKITGDQDENNTPGFTSFSLIASMVIISLCKLCRRIKQN